MKIQVLLVALLCSVMTVEIVTPMNAGVAARKAAAAKKEAEARAATTALRAEDEGGDFVSGRGFIDGGETRRVMPARPAASAVCLPPDVQAAIDADPAGAAAAAAEALHILNLPDAASNRTVAGYLR